MHPVLHPTIATLLILLLRPPMGESLDSLAALYSPKHPGDRTRHAASPAHQNNVEPCLEKRQSQARRPIIPLLWKRMDHAEHLWPDTHPTGSHMIPAGSSEGSLLVEREKDLSTYNWNSFGLRYGKRQEDNRTKR